MERARLDKDSSELLERNKNLAQSQEAYLKVSQIGNIIETRRETTTKNKDGTVKRSILKEQFANVTKRKHENDENEDPSKNKKNELILFLDYPAPLSSPP